MATFRNQECSKLLDAINKSNIEELTELLIMNKALLNISINYEFGCNEIENLELPVLHIVASKNNCMIASLLIEQGANVNQCDKYGTSAMHWAATSGHIKMIKLLLRHNADINIRDVLGMTALHAAAYSGKTKTIKFLLSVGADKTITSNDNEMALDLAIANNNINCINMLKYQVCDVLHNEISIRIALDDDKYNIMMDKIDINKIDHLSDTSFSNVSTETSINDNTDSDNYESISICDKNELKLKSIRLRNNIKKLQQENNDMKQQKNNNMKQQAVKKQIIKELNDAKVKLVDLTNKQKKKQLKINKQNIKIKTLKKDKYKIQQSVISKNSTTNVNKLKKQLYNKLIILQKMNAENAEIKQIIYKKKAEIKQKQSKKLTILEKKRLNFLSWICDIVSLPFYATRFEEYQYNRLDCVVHLDDNELKKIGIKNYYHRRQFLKQIQILKETNHSLIGLSIS